MTPSDRERLQASRRQRLLDLAHREDADFQAVLTRYGLERFLYRLGRSRHRESFLLKGAFLFHAWQNDVARPTQDIDLLGLGSPDIARLEAVVAEISAVEADDDGLDFPTDTIRGEAIRETSLHDGIRIKLLARLGRTRIPLQLDIGFGDAADSHAVDLKFPTLLDLESPWILAYRPQYVIAEKLEAMVALGDINSRLKDYYDLWRILGTMDVAEDDLVVAVRSTFERRGADIPADVPAGLTDVFARDEQKIRLWNSFLSRSGIDAGETTLASVVRELRTRLVPLMGRASMKA